MDKKYKILVCPLGWGLGHAGRMIPVITWLKGRGHHIIIGADDKHFAFFNSELPGNDLIKFPGFKTCLLRFLRLIQSFISNPVAIVPYCT